MAASRRAFIAGMGAASVAGLGAVAGAQEPARPGAGITPGLIHLNTGSLGPTPQPVFDRMLEIWRTVEVNPVVNSYGTGSAVAAADAARTNAAAFLGCAADELLVTNGTTDGMNMVAGSIRFAAGEAVLTSDQEHHGGTAGWTYRARRDGIRIDRVPVPPGESDAQAIVARFAAAIRPETRVICVSHILFSTGLRMPVAEISALARARFALRDRRRAGSRHGPGRCPHDRLPRLCGERP
jgi:selenocysteine lyase/cysteine desulfurase